jgi:hypothetical protein
MRSPCSLHSAFDTDRREKALCDAVSAAPCQFASIALELPFSSSMKVGTDLVGGHEQARREHSGSWCLHGWPSPSHRRLRRSIRCVSPRSTVDRNLRRQCYCPPRDCPRDAQNVVAAGHVPSVSNTRRQFTEGGRLGGRTTGIMAEPGLADMIALDNLNEQTMLKNLHARYQSDVIYVRASAVSSPARTDGRLSGDGAGRRGRPIRGRFWFRLIRTSS